MNWISNVVRPRIRSFLSTKREVPDNLWVQCPESGQMVFHKDLEANAFVVPGSDYHMRMGATDRLTYTFDNGSFERVALPNVPVDPLKFRDGRRYIDRLKDAKSKVEQEDAVLVGEGTIEGARAVVAVQDFRFMGGSLGMAAGEAVITGIERAVASGTPFILFAASGGARMQEGILSLMQMPRTTIAVQRLREAALPYIVVLTDPTTGGVTASYAMLGDIHIAEPGALICFAGPRVIEQTIREQLPDGFQRAEYLLEHGMIDMVVHRHKLRETLARLCRVLAPEAHVTGGRDEGAAAAAVAAAVAATHAADAVPPAPQKVAGTSEAGAAGEAGTTGETAGAASGKADLDATPAPSAEAAAQGDQTAAATAEVKAPAIKPEASMLGDLNILSTLGFATSKPAAKPEDKPAAKPDVNAEAKDASKTAPKDGLAIAQPSDDAAAGGDKPPQVQAGGVASPNAPSKAAKPAATGKSDAQ